MPTGADFIFKFQAQQLKAGSSATRWRGELKRWVLVPCSVLARDLAHTCRNLKSKGIDPKAHGEAERATARQEAQETPCFEAMARTCLKAHSGAWRNPKHRAQ